MMAQQPLELQLHVVSVHNGARASLPYHPQMPCYRYLKEVVVPALGCYTRDHGASVIERFLFQPSSSSDVVVIFTRANRLRRLGDLLPPDAALTRLQTYLGPHPDELRGNATRGDLTVPCAMCGSVAVFTNYELDGCAHRFHANCLGRYMASMAPERWHCLHPGCGNVFDALAESTRLVSALGLDTKPTQQRLTSAVVVRRTQ